MEAFSNSSPNSANTKEIQTELNLPYVQQCSGYESIILNNTCSLDEEKITSFVITPPENILGEPQASVINGLPGECSIEHADSFQLGYPPLQSIPSSPSKAVPDLIDVQYIEAVNDNLTKILEGFTTENPPKVLQNSTNPPVQLSTIRGALSLSSESSHPSHDNFLTLSSPAIFSNAEENNSCNIPPLNVSPLASVVESSNTGSPGTSADTVLPCTPKNEPVEMNNMRGSELRDIEETVVSAMQCSKNRKELDFSSLPILKNPLLKKGRITVLGGRLSSDNPFFKAANVLGRRLVSAQFRGFRDETDEALIRKNFLCDLRAFLAEQELRNVRLPIIGGENLDVYSLARYVMLMGGVENVVRMRAFKLVAVQLGVPKSCTSSAYVLKGAYERILCQYESTLVYGEWPEEQLPDMKSTQSNPKKSEDLSCRTIKCDKGRKEKSPDQKLIQRQCGLQKIIRKSTCTVASARKVTRSAAECGVLERISRFSDFPPLTHRYLRLLAAEESRENIISIWTNGVPRDLPFRDIINRSLDRRDKVHNGTDVLLLSVAACFQPTTRSRCNQLQDLGLARAFLLSPYSTGLFQKAQAVLFRLLLTASKVQDIHLSSSNPSINSTNSLLDGIYGLIQRFRVRLEQRGECTGSQFFSNREEAAAFCSIRILDNLSNHPLNREHLVRHKGFHTALASLFSISVLQRHFVVAVQNILNSCHALLHESAEYDVLVDAMLSKLEKAACIQSNNDDDVPPDLDVSAKALSFLASCTPGVTTCERAIAIASKLLHLQYRIGDTISLSLLACGLVSKYPDRLEGNDSFRAGVFKLLHDPRCTSAVVEILRMMRVLWPLQDCVKDIRQMAELHDHSNQQWQELSEVLHDIAAAPAETAVVEELDKILFSTRVFECHEGNVNATSGDGVLDLLSKSKPLHWEI